MYRPNCPYCGSTQTRYSQQKSDLFQEAHTCNNCGRQFSVALSNPKKKRGFLSTLILALLGGAVICVAIIFIFGRTSHQNSSSPIVEKQTSVADQELKPLSNETVVPDQTVESTPTPIPTPEPPKQEEFTPQAEQNAHAYTPTAEDYKRLEQEKQNQKSIADSQSQNDTISIKTTLRNKSE